MLKYKRILLKISGEALAGEGRFGIDDAMLVQTVRQIKEIIELGVETALVVGGGNFWRGRGALGIDRATADYMGMLATVMNALALRDAFEAAGIEARIQSAIAMDGVAAPYSRNESVAFLKQKAVVIFAAGTGNPYFSTDTAAALRAAEIGADVILLAKKVDAVYSDDPEKNPDAVRYSELSHQEVLEKDLKVMDSTAASLCRDNNITIHVFGLSQPGNVIKAVHGENIGTIVR
ncbi:MAG: UMP kinase [Clostridiales Family XIII bacterium]|jgi:uridylate kinase|nr:UMP kinase [Clostridiales Family XIII bacterium]